MAEVLDYRRRLEKPLRRCPEVEAQLLSMQNERDDEFRRLDRERRNRQLVTEAAVALRAIYKAHNDTLMAHTLISEAHNEARKILSCQT